MRGSSLFCRSRDRARLSDGGGFQEIKLPFELPKMPLVMNKLGQNRADPAGRNERLTQANSRTSAGVFYRFQLSITQYFLLFLKEKRTMRFLG